MMIRLALLFVLLSSAALFGQVQLCTPEKIEALKASLPLTTNEEWQDVFNDPLTFFYTDAEMPLAYQHADRGLLVGGSRIGSNPNTSFHSPRYNISGDAREAAKGNGFGGNANIEFPWRNPGGTDGGESNVRTFKFMRLPRKETGVWPVIWWPTELRGARTGVHYGYGWSFPIGTIFGECLCVRDSAGLLHTFEVRLRVRGAEYWDIEILRPFPTAKSLAVRLSVLSNSLDSSANQTVMSLLTEGPVREQSLVDRLHPTKIGFAAKAGIDTLPNFSESVVKELLDNTPFDSAVGAEWRRGTNGVAVHSPSTDQTFSIVPKNYHGTFIGTDTDSCAKCHESTMQHVDVFDNRRDWYGYVRGSMDGIFSFHPVAPESISYNGFPKQVAFRKVFVDNGIIERYNPNNHPVERYTLIKR